MTAHEPREQELVLAREAGHDAVLEQVLAVAVVAGVGDRQSELVQARGPRDHAARADGFDAPRARHLVHAVQGRALDAHGVLDVDVEAVREAADRPVADVLVPDASEQVPQDPLAQCGARRFHALDPEALERREEDREAARQDGSAVGRYALDEFIRAALAQERLPELLQRRERDAALAPTGPAHDLLDRRDRSRRSDALLPARGPDALSDRLELELRGEHGLLEGLLLDDSVGEEAHRPAHAAHVQAVDLERFEAFTQDHLGAAAADVDDQARAGDQGLVVRDAEVDQARFLGAAQDLDRVSERRRRARQERARVRRPTQRARAHGAHALVRDARQSLAEAREAFEPALLGGLVEAALLVESRGQPHRLPQPVEALHAVALGQRDHEVEAVRAEVHGRHVSLGGAGRRRIPRAHGSRSTVPGAR